MVGIVIDQFRYDYIDKYWEDYGNDGFKRLSREGFSCRDNHFGYAPTYTGPGHASVYTGTTPAVHGIIANNWYVRNEGKEVYCAHDSTEVGIGVFGYDGQMNPKRLLSSTITDELKLFSNQRSKVIGMSMKDRGAILPAGHMADAAYWFVGKDQGDFVSSNYYMEDLPSWVKEFNASSRKDDYLNEGWNLLRDPEVYDESLPDNNPYEGNIGTRIRPTFPYDLAELAAGGEGYELIKSTPVGNRILTDFAIESLKAEQLGADEITDFLCISYSSTDYVGHRFGTNAQETQDTYLRLDQDIARLLKALDLYVGKNSYTLFVTADHGAATNTAYNKSQGANVDYYKQPEIEAFLNEELSKQFGTADYIESLTNDQVFLDQVVIERKKASALDVERAIVDAAMQIEAVQLAIGREQLEGGDFTTGHYAIVKAGWNQKSSGDVVLVMRPGWLEYGPVGTTHGSPYAYDTHVPLLFFGKHVERGYTYDRTYIRDIAPTVAGLLHIQMPNGTTGRPITSLLNQ